MSEILPKIRKEGIFEKIRNWFKSIFYKNSNIINEPQINTNIKEKEGNIFIENNNKIFVLQKRLKEGMIEVSDLTDEELDQLIELYEKQIAEKKEKVKYYREKIMLAKKEE